MLRRETFEWGSCDNNHVTLIWEEVKQNGDAGADDRTRRSNLNAFWSVAKIETINQIVENLMPKRYPTPFHAKPRTSTTPERRLMAQGFWIVFQASTVTQLETPRARNFAKTLWTRVEVNHKATFVTKHQHLTRSSSVYRSAGIRRWERCDAIASLEDDRMSLVLGSESNAAFLSAAKRTQNLRVARRAVETTSSRSQAAIKLEA